MSGETTQPGTTSTTSWESTSVETSVDFHAEFRSSSGTASSSETYTSDDGTTYGPDGCPVSEAGGTPTMTSYDTNRDGYYEATGTDADGDGYAETISADEDRDGYDDYAISDHDRDGTVDEVVLDTNADGWGDAAITDGAPYGAEGTVAIADTDGDTYADLVVPAV
jgi:hypothetical protein